MSTRRADYESFRAGVVKVMCTWASRASLDRTRAIWTREESSEKMPRTDSPESDHIDIVPRQDWSRPATHACGESSCSRRRELHGSQAHIRELVGEMEKDLGRA